MFKLKLFRTEHGLYQSELAKLMNVSTSTISAIEVGNKDLTPKQYQVLYDKYGKEEVDRYREYIDGYGNVVKLSPQKNYTKEDLLEMIDRLNDALVEHMKRQDEMADRFISVLEMVTRHIGKENDGKEG